MKIRRLGSGLQLSYGNFFYTLSHGVLQPGPEGSCLGEIIPAVHLPSPRTDAALCLDHPSTTLFSAKPSSLTQAHTFFWHCLQGQKTSVASTHISQRSSSRGTGDAQEEPPAPSVVLSPPTTSQPNQSSCRPFRNQLHPHAATHREVKPGEQHQGLAHPGQRDVSVRAGMSCCLDLPLYLPLLQSRQPATISFPTSFN